MTATLVVLISGSGTNLEAIVEAIETNKLNAKIALAISNRKAAYGLIRAEEHQIPTLYFPLKPYLNEGKSRENYDADLAMRVAECEPTLVVLAGWLHVFSPAFLDSFPGHVINLHPALPGTFPGLHAIERAFEAYQRGEISESGCMIHHVIPEVDAGVVITKTTVPFQDGDTLEVFEQRMHEAEHQLIVEGICLALEDLA